MIIAGGIHGVLDQGQHGIILRFGFLPSLERLLYSGRRLVVLALYATSTRSTEWGGDLHGPRMIFPEKIGMIFVPYSRRGPIFDLLLSISLLERMIPCKMIVVIKFFGDKGVWQVSTSARVWCYDCPGAQQTCENTQLATRV